MIVFGNNLAGIYRLNDWLKTANNSNADVFNRHAGIAKIREFFPLSDELDNHTYKAWGLEKADDAILKGIPDWSRTKEPEKENKPTISPHYSGGIMKFYRSQL